MIVKVSVLDQTKRCCPLHHGKLLGVTIVKLPSQNFSQVVWFKLLLRDISLRTFFISGVTFDLRVIVDISFLNTYVNGRFVQ